MIPVEVIEYIASECKIIARGEISDEDAKLENIPKCPDDVIRLSVYAWDTMTPEAKMNLSVKFNLVEI